MPHIKKLGGRYLRLTAPRLFILDMMHYARRVPSIPVARTMSLGPLSEARKAHPARPSWAILFLKAYARVAAENSELRRALVSFPTLRLYEHDHSIASLALEREYEGEPGIFVGLFRSPETQSIEELEKGLEEYKSMPLERIGFFRQAVRISRCPRPIRRFLWWSSLEISGAKRAKRLGTFGLSSYGALGAESLHPISPLTTTLTYGPIDAEGKVSVKIIYDHRALDGAQVARRLGDLERMLLGPILEELRQAAAAGQGVREPHLGPSRPAEAMARPA
jgi:hypothetical protein